MRHEYIEQVHELLNTKFPVLKDHYPLAIGVYMELLPLVSELDKKEFRLLMMRVTKSNKYMSNMVSMEHRYNLAGEPVAEISAKHKTMAADELKARAKKKGGKQPTPKTKVPKTKVSMVKQAADVKVTMKRPRFSTTLTLRKKA